MTGTAAELVPVREIDDHVIGTGSAGPVTQSVQAIFEDALHGRDERYTRLARRRPRGDAGRMTPGVELYDATLRDGMGGAGIALTADEKVRVVHKLDELGVDLIEAGFPSSNPKEAALFCLPGRRDARRTPRSSPSG